MTWSPDGRFVVTSMQENTLHGWRLSDKKDMRMSGYPSKTRSFSWSHDGQWLGTSGADAAIVWPFSSKDGPMGKAPRECGIRPAKVSRVSFHPGALVLAIGYEDGFVLLCRLTDAAESAGPQGGRGQRRRSPRWPGTRRAASCCSAPMAALPAISPAGLACPSVAEWPDLPPAGHFRPAKIDPETSERIKRWVRQALALAR